MSSDCKQQFHNSHSLSQRSTDSRHILNSYPEYIPAFIYKSSKSTLSDLYKNKIIIPRDMNLNQFVYILYTRLRIADDKPLKFYIDGVLVNRTISFDVLYKTHKENDNFLYIEYSESENESNILSKLKNLWG